MTAVLITRPAEQAQLFAQALDARFGADLDVVLSPVLSYVQLTPKIDFEDFDGVVLTSQNGLRGYLAVGGPARGVAYCVGDKTAQAAAEAGFEARSASGDLQALNALLSREAGSARLLYPCGRHVSGNITGPVRKIAVYDQKPCPLSADACDMIAQPGELIVPHFSVRSAKAFHAALPASRARSLFAIAISAAVAEVLPVSDYAEFAVAAQPTAEAMMDKISGILPRGSA